MGYWKAQSRQNLSEIGVWGDQEADIMDDALFRICEVFYRNWGRMPTKKEIVYGFEFAMPIKDWYRKDIENKLIAEHKERIEKEAIRRAE